MDSHDKVLASVVGLIILIVIVACTIDARFAYSMERTCAQSGGIILKIESARGCFQLTPISNDTMQFTHDTAGAR